MLYAISAPNVGRPTDLVALAKAAEGVPAAEYESAGATWLVDSRWPDGEWFDELAEAAARGPAR